MEINTESLRMYNKKESFDSDIQQNTVYPLQIPLKTDRKICLGSPKTPLDLPIRSSLRLNYGQVDSLNFHVIGATSKLKICTRFNEVPSSALGGFRDDIHLGIISPCLGHRNYQTITSQHEILQPQIFYYLSFLNKFYVN